MVSITTQMPATGLIVPTDRELRELREIVEAKYPDWRSDDQIFRRAFIAVGYQFRLAEPSKKKYLVHHIADANEFLAERFGQDGVDGPSFMAAVLASGDVPWQAGNRGLGVPLAIGLDPHSGRRCLNSWMGLLKGQPLVLSSPLPRSMRRDDVPQPRTYEKYPDGTMKEIDTRNWQG